MVPLAETAWDTVTLLVCLSAVFYLTKLYSSFKGGSLGRAYGYYITAGLVLVVGFGIKVGLDFEGISPTDYGLSVRDFAIIIALVLFAVGLRASTKFWDPAAMGKRGMGGQSLRAAVD
jgi:hypothetical protein